MEKVKYSEETRYVWECPICYYINEETEDLTYEEEIICGSCGETFEPEAE